MAVAGIWCMHFIGNRAIIMGNGDNSIQLIYEPGMTAASAGTPLFGLILAFGFAEMASNMRAGYRGLINATTGIVAGACIVGMHYIANRGVLNYRLHYSPRYIFAACLIATVDCLLVLYMFYDLREKWINAAWKRLVCAGFLAVGVCAMHFTASVGCSYEFLAPATDEEIYHRDIQVAIAAVICGCLILGEGVWIFYVRRKAGQRKEKSQKITLSTAIFHEGRILVTTDGVLPSRVISEKYDHHTFQEEFDRTHPVFQWIFRVTHNWASVKAMIPNMKSHLSAQQGIVEDSRPSSSQSSAIYGAETYNNYDTLFKESFCTVAASIASSLQIPLENIGILYDTIVETGNLVNQQRGDADQSPANLELAVELRPQQVGDGQLLFLVKNVTHSEAASLLNTGHKFAGIPQVSGTISEALQIPIARGAKHLTDLRRYINDLEDTVKTGTWLAFFAMIPKINFGGFNIVVKKDRHDQIPDVNMLTTQPEPWQVVFLDKLNGLRIQEILTILDSRAGRNRGQSHEVAFTVVFRQAILDLTRDLPRVWVNQAKFWSQRLYAHYTRPLNDQSPPTTMYAFTVIADIHARLEPYPIASVPETFFAARVRCYAGSPDHAELAQRIYAELSPVYANRRSQPGRREQISAAFTGGKTPIKRLAKLHSQASSAPGSGGEGGGSVYELVEYPQHTLDPSRLAEPQPAYLRGNRPPVVGSEAQGGAEEVVVVATVEPEKTFVDELMLRARQSSQPAVARDGS